MKPKISPGSLSRFVMYAFACLLVYVLAPTAHAASPVVGCDADELIGAVTAANASPEADTLELSAGCIYVLTDIDNTSEPYGPNGLPVIVGDLTLTGNGATITRAGDAPGFRFFQVSKTASLSLDQLVLEKGQLDPTTLEQSAYHGGAIYNFGTLNLTESVLRENWAHESGGGVFNDGGAVTVTDSNLLGNGVNWAVIATVHGGAIFSREGTITVSGGEFRDNLASDDGAAIYSEGTVHISQTRFINNSTTLQEGRGGGAVFSMGSANINASTFDGNQTMLYGGALHIEGAASVSDSTFARNSAWGAHGSGGGGAISGPANVTNSTFYDNSAGMYANGAAIEGGGTILNSTFSLNMSERTDGLAASILGGVLVNSILDETNCMGVTDGGGNLYWPESNSGCGGTAGKPKLGQLQDNGGLTETMAPRADSAALNAAVDAECPTSDQRGVARPQGKHCDIGAFELEPPTAPNLLLPRDDKKFSHARANLRWETAGRVVNYRVVVRQDSYAGAKVVDLYVMPSEYKTPALESGHWYYWRVRACSNVDCTASGWRRFRVK